MMNPDFIHRWAMRAAILSCAVLGASMFSIATFSIAAAAEQAEHTNTQQTSAQQASLVQRLGDEGFAARNAAADQLLRTGEAARPALLTGLQHPDPEIRDRCQQILAALDVQRQRDQLAAEEARLVVLLNDEQASEKDYDLPGWRRFRADVGCDRDARNLFVDMQHSERALLAMADASDGKEEIRALNDELQREITSVARSLSHPLPQFRAQVTPGRAAALVFVASGEGVELPSTVASQLYSMMLQPRVRGIAADAKGGEYLRKILRHWVVVDQPGDANLPYYKLMLAVQLDIKEGLQVARRIIREQKGAARPYEYMQAITAVCRFGSKEQVPELESLLSNKTVCYTLHINNKMYTTEVRDVALAAAIQLTGQKHADYGMDRVQTNPQTVFVAHTVGFAKEDESKRAEAFARWDRWKAGQKREPAKKSGPPKASEPD